MLSCLLISDGLFLGPLTFPITFEFLGPMTFEFLGPMTFELPLFSVFSCAVIFLPCPPKCLLPDEDGGREEGELGSNLAGPLGTFSLDGGKEEFAKVFVTNSFLFVCSLPILGFSVVEIDPCQVLQLRSRSMSSVFEGKTFPLWESLFPCPPTFSSFWDISSLPDRGLGLGFALANPSVMGSSSGALARLAVFSPLGVKFLNR